MLALPGAQGMTAELVRPPKEPLKHARSQAELTRVRQGWCLIALAATNICITALIALHVFGVL